MTLSDTYYEATIQNKIAREYVMSKFDKKNIELQQTPSLFMKLHKQQHNDIS